MRFPHAIALAALLAASTSFPTQAVIAPPAEHHAQWQQKQIITTMWCPPPADDGPLTDCANQHFTLTWCKEAGLPNVAKHHL